MIVLSTFRPFAIVKYAHAKRAMGRKVPVDRQIIANRAARPYSRASLADTRGGAGRSSAKRWR
jgi:hypothetical protein